MAGRGSAGTPTTYTIYSAGADGYLYGGWDNSTITNAPETAGDIYVGQQVTSLRGYQGFLAFDTSAVVGTITAATLSVYGTLDASTIDFTLEARIHDWGATLDTADWIAYTDQAAKTLVASLSTAGYNAAGYNAFTSDAAFISNINKTGFTRLALLSSRQRNHDSPSGTEFVGFSGGDQAGTTQDPKLVIEALV